MNGVCEVCKVVFPDARMGVLEALKSTSWLFNQLFLYIISEQKLWDYIKLELSLILNMGGPSHKGDKTGSGDTTLIEDDVEDN